jgi:hypothetical protein
MKKVSLDVWVQLVGLLSVVAGLFFVGFEMRKSQQIALASQQQERASLVTEIIGSFAEVDPPISMLNYLDGNIDLSDPDKRAIVETFVYRMWMVYENDYLQYDLGLMNEEIWQAKLSSMRNMYNRCQFKDVTEKALSFSSEELLTLLINSGTHENEDLPADCRDDEELLETFSGDGSLDDEMYDSGYKDGYVSWSNSSCEMESRLRANPENDFYQKGYEEGYAEGAIDCNKMILTEEIRPQKGETVFVEDYGELGNDSLICRYNNGRRTVTKVYWYAPNDILGRSQCQSIEDAN